MAKGAWSATAVSSELVPASTYRSSVIIQLLSGDQMSLGLGEDAVFGEGTTLREAGDYIEIRKPQSRLAINGICDTGNSASGGYQEG